jgi:hypothetical protein
VRREWWRFLPALIFGLCATSLAQAQSEIRLQTADTIVEIAAGASAPILKRFSVPGQIPWTNELAEVLPDHAEVDGRRVALAWKFARQESETGPRRVVLAYKTSSPNLRLTWEWRLRADYGPVEHLIRIENRSGKEVWLPFQDSRCLSFPFVKARSSGTSLWRKGADRPSAAGTHDVAVKEGYAWQGTSSTYAIREKTKIVK